MLKISNLSLYSLLRHDDMNSIYEVKVKKGKVAVVLTGEIAKEIIVRAIKDDDADGK